MDNTVAGELNKENVNEFELDIFMAIVKIRSDEKRPYLESIFIYISSINKYENFTLNFRNDRILILLDDEMIIDKKRSGRDSLYLTEKTLRLLASKSMDPTPTSQDTSIIVRNLRRTKTDDGNLTDLTFPTSQNTPFFDLNGIKDDDKNLTVLTAPSSQDITVNRNSNNDNNNVENLIDVKSEFEALKTFLMEELYHLRQQVKKLNIEEVNSGIERYNDFLPNHLQSEINYLREENENKNSIIKVSLENKKLSIHGPSPSLGKTIEKCNSENEISPEPEFISSKKCAKQTTLSTHAFITKNCVDVLRASGDEDCNKSVSMPVKLLKQRPNKDLNRAKKTTVNISESNLKRVIGVKLNRDIEKKEQIKVKACPGATTNYL